jgi:hypothetical protein
MRTSRVIAQARNWMLVVCLLLVSFSVNAAAVKVENLPTETTPATGDEIFLTDISASNDTNKITLTNFFANVPADVVMTGTTPSLTVGDAGAEDTSINYDGNAQDFHIALDDSADALEIGFGTTVETDERLTIDGSPTETIITIGDAAAEDQSLNFDGNAVDFHISLDDSADELEIGFGTTIETDERLTIGGGLTATTITIGDAAAEDMSVIIDGNVQDFHISLDDSDDSLEIGFGSTIETDERITINGSPTETIIEIGDAAEEDQRIEFDGNAQNWHLALDDSADDFIIGLGSTIATTEYLTFLDNSFVITVSDAGAQDAGFLIDGNAQDFYIALDDTADDLVLGLGATVGTTPCVSFDENQIATFPKVAVFTTGHTNTASSVTPDAVSGGTIAAGFTGVDVQAVTNDANDWIVLPAIANVPVGHTIYIACNAGTNFELRTVAASNTKINTVDADGGAAEYLCTDTDLIRVTSMGATDGYVAQSITALGAVRTAVVPDA